MDRPVRDEPPAPGQSRLPHGRHSADRLSILPFVALVVPGSEGLAGAVRGGWSCSSSGTLEGKPPEFFNDWRFLCGPRWWVAKVRRA
jgi:hypothetical protein